MVQRIINAIFGKDVVSEEEVDVPDVDNEIKDARIKGHISPDKNMPIHEKVEMCQKAIKKQTKHFKKKR